MLKNILKSIFTLIGAAAGWLLGVFLLNLDFFRNLTIMENQIMRYSITALIAFIRFFIFHPVPDIHQTHHKNQ